MPTKPRTGFARITWCLTLLLLVGQAPGRQTRGAGLPEGQAAPQMLVKRVADRVLRDFPQPPPFDWGEGVLLTGMMRAYQLTHDGSYLEFVRKFGDRWSEKGIGPLLKQKGYCGHWGPGLPLLMLHEATGEQRYLALSTSIVDFILHQAERTKDGGLSHFSGKPQLWVDTLAMSCPLLAHGSRLAQAPQWQEEAARQLEIFTRHLQDPGTGLFYHVWDEASGQRTPAFWARGNGWVVMTFADVLKTARSGSPSWDALRQAFAKQLSALVPLQDRESGLWRTVLDAPETYLETSASAMFLYGLAENQRLNLVPGPEAGVLKKAWAGLAAKVDAQGRVQGVSAGTTPGGKQRYAAVPVGAYTWGTGAFLLAACAYEACRFMAPDGAEMVLVPAGPFIMGSLEGRDDEKPPHVVNLPAFYIDRYEVTCEQYNAFLKATGRKAPVNWPEGKMPPKLARHPVVNVTFDDAQACAQWAGKRLPTEAEWEKACRGSEGRVYPWGNSPAGKKSATPLGDNSKDHTWPVGSFPDDLSPCGAMDMAGNAWEWTASWYEAYPGNDQLEIEYGRKCRVIRGGGAIDYYGVTATRRGAERARSLPYGTYDALGFRCVKDAP